MSKIGTNLASEFWFFSQLHRLGYKAYITLGNTKRVDMMVELENGVLVTFDVKGKTSFRNGTYPFIKRSTAVANHYYVFVGLEAKYDSNTKLTTIQGDPECYLVEARHLGKIAYSWVASNGIGTGYGFDQRIFEILKADAPVNSLSKKEKRVRTHFISMHKCTNSEFSQLKQHVLTLADFERKYHSLK